MSAGQEADESTTDASTDSTSDAKPTKKRGKKKARKKTSKAKASSPTEKQADAKKISKVKKTAKKPKPPATPRGTRRVFPKHTLEEALRVADVIEMKNSGKPWATDQVAQACGTTKSASSFFYLSSAARDYGLTAGSWTTETIELTDLGRKIVQPTSPEERVEGLRAAFHTVELFKQVDNHYGAKSLPEDQYFDSLVEKQFGVPRPHLADFRNLFKKNRDFLAQQGVRPEAPPRAAHASDGVAPTAGDVNVVVSTHGKTAFVIMPFSEKGKEPRAKGFFQEVLKQIITPAGDLAKFNVVTALQSGSDVIQTTIIEHLVRADLVIADLTDHNPNVLLELGVAIALDKLVVLIRAEGTPGIFDVDNMMRVEQYNPLLWVDTVKADVARISKHIADGYQRRKSNRRYMDILAGSKWRELVVTADG